MTVSACRASRCVANAALTVETIVMDAIASRPKLPLRSKVNRPI